jgi:hypothetical protein
MGWKNIRVIKIDIKETLPRYQVEQKAALDLEKEVLQDE